MNLRYVFVDFDETLFEHYAYLDWFDEELHEAGLLPEGSGSFRQGVDKHHDVRSQVPLLRLYKHQAHLMEATGRDWQFISGEMEKKVAQRTRDFCYPDSHDFLAWLKAQPYDSRVLTYGDGDYQRFKIGLCHGNTAYFPAHVTDNPKNEFLAKEFPDERGILIDDKYPLDLPDNWLHLWITRKESLKQPKKLTDRVYQVSNLKQARHVIEEL